MSIIGVQTLLVFATALLFALAVTPLLLRFATAYQIYDFPDQIRSGENRRRAHAIPTPRLGGAAIVFASLVSVCIWASPEISWKVFAPSLLLFTIGLYDDFSPLPPVVKLGGQLLGAAAVVWLADLPIETVSLTPSNAFEIPHYLGFALSVFIIVGSVNSINMIDGLDGLAGGITLIAVALLSYLHFLATGSLFVTIIFGLPIVGALIGFLRYNTHPAEIFMGDGGSHWLGFVVGVLILFDLTGWAPNHGRYSLGSPLLSPGTHVVAIAPLLCAAVPVFDSIAVICRRILAGRNPMKADNSHFHHGLMRIGFSHSQSVAIIYFLALAIGICAILPIAYPDRTLAWAPYIATAFLTCLLPFVMSLNEGKVATLKSHAKAATENLRRIGISHGIALRSLESSNRYTMYGILMVTPLFAGVPVESVGYAAIFGLLLVLSSYMLPHRKQDFLSALILSVTAAILLVANNMNPIWVELEGKRYSFQYIYNTAFIWLLISTCLLLVLSFKRRYLLVTPTDFLVVSLPLILLVPDPYRSQFRLDIIALRSWVLFVAIRFMVRRNKRIANRLRLVLAVGLAFVMMTSVFGLRIIY